MHIAFLTSEYPPLHHGGIGTSIRNLGRALVTSGHQVTVVGWGESAEFEDNGVKVRFLGDSSFPKMGWLINRRAAQKELNRLVREQRVDIVEAQDWCGLSAGIRLDCPLTIRCHGSATYFAHLLHEKVRPSVRWAESLALKQADSVTAVSRFTAESTRQLFGLDQPVGVIPNGVDTSYFHPGIPEEVAANSILYLGTVVRKKGVLDLCQAFSRVAGERANARLYLIGRDVPDQRTGSPSTWELCRNALSPEAAKRVEYIGVQPHEKVLTLIRRAALCVFPSYAEAFPIAWLEAMACAKPIIAYDIGWASEIVETGVNGILIKLGDVEALAQSMISLLENPVERYALGAAARKRVELEFTSQLVASQTLEYYQHVLAR
jgi:glycosyltransferase involved in cell wall biosynthesis